ncbi:MAG: CHC2 zinc finger domain-containing protein, partial [Candidatus Humimicrobiaceae bacterium]
MPKSLKDGEVDELKARTDIVDIISEYVNLKKQGKNFLGLCPFHKEKTPSFSVDPSRQFFHCFGCGVGGDVINFVEKIENMEFIESVEFIAKKVGYNLQYSYSGSPKTKKLRERLVGLNDLARKYYHYILFNSSPGKAALEYLQKRGFKRDILEKFQVGYSLNNWDNFSLFAQKRGYKGKELIEAGLSIK